MGRAPSGAGMAFVPRDQFAQRSAFGRLTTGVVPADGVDRADRRFRSALLQHTISLAVHDALARSGMTLGAVLSSASDRHGLSADRVRRVLRGETGAQFADLVFWADLFPEIAERVGEFFLDWTSFGELEHTREPSGQPDREADGLDPIQPHELSAFRKYQQDNLAQLRAQAAARPKRGIQPHRPPTPFN